MGDLSGAVQSTQGLGEELARRKTAQGHFRRGRRLGYPRAKYHVTDYLRKCGARSATPSRPMWDNRSLGTGQDRWSGVGRRGSTPGSDVRLTLMSLGFLHGDGWFDILWRLCEDVEPLVAEFEEGSGRCFEVLQVKE